MLALTRSGLGAEPTRTTATTSYRCNSTICYGADGTGVMHARFKETQYQMNRAGAAIFGASWVKIGVDGFIGEKTRVAYAKLAPKISALVGANYYKPTYFVDLARWIATSGTFIPDALRKAADARTGMSQTPGQIQTRQEAYAQEGPAKDSAASPAGQVSTVPVPSPTGPTSAGPATNQVPATVPTADGGVIMPAPTGMSTAGKVILGVTAATAAVGLIAAAVYVAKKRRRG